MKLCVMIFSFIFEIMDTGGGMVAVDISLSGILSEKMGFECHIFQRRRRKTKVESTIYFALNER